ncbi:MAG: hypothetical protein JAY90_14540 [Candidatus Thiodiazotropha lotti]|nr:hypothetical protein [Candidatus Thiodiazotropha lotti]
MSINSAIKISIILTAFFSYLFIAVSFPLSGHNDTQVHIDYAWQISNGSTPDFYQGLTLPYELKKDEIQFAAHHPPLYYKLISPITGYLVNNDYSYSTVVLGVRVANSVIALLILILVAIYSELFNLFKRPNFDILFLTVFAFFIPFIKVSSLVFNEITLVLLVTATWIATLKIIRTGYTHKAFAAYLICVSLGLYSKVSFLPVFLISISLLFRHLYFERRSNTLSTNTPNPLLLVMLAFTSVVWISGEFYFNNYLNSGYFWRAAPQSWVVDFGTNRKFKDLEDVLTSGKMWSYIVTSPLIVGLQYRIDNSLFIGLVYTATLVAYISFLTKFAQRTIKSSIDRKTLLISVAFILLIIAVYLEMIVHAKGYGNYNPRYIIPAITVICAILATGLLSIKRYELPVIGGYFILGNLAVLSFIAIKYTTVTSEINWFNIANHASTIAESQQLPYTLIVGIILMWATSGITSLLLIFNKKSALEFNLKLQNSIPNSSLTLALLIILSIYALYTNFLINDLKVGIPPDEVAHLSRIAGIKEQGSIPDPVTEKLCSHGGRQTQDLNYLKHPPIYYYISSFLTKKSDCMVVTDYKVFRVSSLIIISLTLIFLIAVIRRTSYDDSGLITFLLFLTSIPIFPYISASTNNDSLAIASFYAVIASWLLVYKNIHTKYTAVFLSAAITICLLTKATTGLQALILSFFLILFLSKDQITTLWSQRLSLLVSLFLLSIAAIYYLYIKIEYGTFFPAGASLLDNYTKDPRNAMGIFQYAGHYFDATLKSLIGITSHSNVYKQSTIQAYGIILFFFVSLSQLFKKPGNSDLLPLWKMYIAGTITTLIFTLIHFIYIYQKYLTYGYLGGIQFRYFLPLLPLVSIGYLLWHDQTRTSLKIIVPIVIIPSLIWSNLFYYYDHRLSTSNRQVKKSSLYSPGQQLKALYQDNSVTISGPIDKCDDNSASKIVTFFKGDIFSIHDTSATTETINLNYTIPLTCEQFKEQFKYIQLLHYCSAEKKFEADLKDLTVCGN